MPEDYEEFISLTPEDQGIQRDHEECSQEIGNTNGLRYALQDKQEKQAWRNPWQNQRVQIKTCVYLGSQWIHKTAFGRISTELSWGPFRRKREQLTTALQFGTQIYSYASSNEDTRSKSSSG